MKRLLPLALLALTSCAILSAPGEVQPLTLAWDFNPPEDQVTQYHIYRVDGVGVYTKVASVPGTTNRVTFVPDSPGLKVYVATAQNSFEESGPSNDVRTVPSNNPKNVKTTQ